MKRALITGITGQDGSYLAELLLSRGYEVHGIVRPSTTQDRRHLRNLSAVADNPRLHLHQGDMGMPETVTQHLWRVEPDEVYNLAGQSHVTTSFELPGYTSTVNATAVTQLLETVRKLGRTTRFYQASSSEIYGGLPGSDPQSETTRFHPRSPYAVAKLAAYWAVRHAREAYGLFACNGILFNHESPRRGAEFVTRKISLAVARIAQNDGRQERLVLGTLDPLRDWGYAPEYVDAMTRMLAADKPDDYVVATGRCHTVREFVEAAFFAIDIKLTWHGEGSNERAEDQRGRVRVELDPQFARPSEVMILCGDASRAKELLGWEAVTRGTALAGLMVRHDLENERA